MERLDVGAIMRMNLGALQPACKQRGLPAYGQRWELAVRLAVHEDPDLLRGLPNVPVRKSMKEADTQTDRRVLTVNFGVAACSVSAADCEPAQDEDLVDDDSSFHTPQKQTASHTDAANVPTPVSETKLYKYNVRHGLAGTSSGKRKADEIASSIGFCQVCSQETCICPPKVRTMAEMTKFEISGVERKQWLMFKIDKGVSLAGCWICKQYAESGQPLQGRQALGRFELQVLNHNIHARDTISQHAARATGDHSKAVSWLKQTFSDADLALDPAPETPAVRRRQIESVSEAEENMIILGYKCLQLNLSSSQFSGLSSLCYDLGACLTNAHFSARFYRDLTQAAGVALFKQLLNTVRESPAISISADEGVQGSGFFCIRVGFLDSFLQPQTAFWQMRHVHDKTADGLVEEIIRSFCESPCPEMVPPQAMLSQQCLAQKLVAFTADGAAVNGVQRSGKPLSSPRSGDNIAYNLLQMKKQWSEESLLVAWCSSHKVDLTCKRFESEPYVCTLLQSIRKLVNHIQKSSGAQAELKALAVLLREEDQSAAASSASFAPQRFVSHSQPCECLCKSFKEIISYLAKLKTSADQSQRFWAVNLGIDIEALQFWLVLCATGDLLRILRRVNIKTQRSDLKILDLQPILAAARAEFEAYVRQGDGVLAESLRTLCVPARRRGQGPRAEWLLQGFTQSVHVQQQAPGSYVSKYGVGDGWECSLQMTSTTLSTVVEIVQSLASLALQDLDSRYDAMLYIVVQRQDARTDAVAFQSHLFATSRNAQVAVMDTYVGKAKAALLLVNASGEEEAKEGQPSYTVMPFGTAFGVADGNYQVILSDGSADSKIRSPMQAKEGESYLVLRTGAGLAGKGSEMDLMVFPSPSWAERSAAFPSSCSFVTLTVLLAAFLKL